MRVHVESNWQNNQAVAEVAEGDQYYVQMDGIPG